MSSKNESRISDLLQLNSIPFYTEYSPPNLYGLRGTPYRFDFAIISPFDDIAYFIEVDGEQHFTPISHFGGERGYLATRYRDNRKEVYCREHNIPLIRIPYYAIPNLTKEDITLQSKYRLF